MAQKGTFGDNLEIQAFAREFGVDVKIYQREHAYVISADYGAGAARIAAGEERKVVHIAYHVSFLYQFGWVEVRGLWGDNADGCRPGNITRR